MTLDQHLNTLEDSGLVYPVQLSSELEYIFRHALVQEAAYASLLRQDRRRLHLAVGEALERNFPDQLNKLAPMLAQHFAEASDNVRAAKYYALAGEQSMQQYAIPEAITQYCHAIDIVHKLNDAGQLAALLRSRGIAYEASGAFDKARADHEMALQLSRDAHDDRLQWQELLNLGMLWAGSDYTHTGAYYQQAYQLAQQMNDAESMAHTLNHLGNWLVNIEQAHEAVRYHGQALEIFEQIHDPHGIANTEDFLSMATALSGDMRGTAIHSQRAIALFKQLNDQRGLANIMASITLRSANYQTTTVESESTLPEMIREGEDAVQLARRIGWRSIEAFALNTLALNLASMGEYTQALETCRQGYAIAQEIGHRQWLTYAYYMLGITYLEMFAYPAARMHMQQAVALAKEINSLYWVRTCGSALASILIAMGNLEDAEATLNSLQATDSTPLTLSQRLFWCTRGELALACHDPRESLRIVDMLYDQNSHIESKKILRLTYLRGEALAAMGRHQEAEADLSAALALATLHGARPMQWRAYVSLGHAYHAQGRDAEARQAHTAARAITIDLATRMPPDYQDEYNRQAELLCSFSQH
jgi:tetratricopeptide (TPR) repeat protein